MEREEKLKGNWRDSSCGRCIRCLSLGQYVTKLYHKGEDGHSSIFGGIVTIIAGVLFAIYTIFVLWNTIITKDKYSLSEEILGIN